MVPALQLWLPILVSAAAVFIMSTVIHMLLGYHANDFKKAPDEDGLMDALRKLDIPPGEYAVPKASSAKEMGSDEFREKYHRGPAAFMTIVPLEGNPFNMNRQFIQWFLYAAVVGLFTAYLTGVAYGPDASYMEVFRFASATTFIAYALGQPIRSIWFYQSWGTAFRNMLDGLIYGLVTGGVFGWLWP